MLTASASVILWFLSTHEARSKNKAWVLPEGIVDYRQCEFEISSQTIDAAKLKGEKSAGGRFKSR